MNTTIQPENFNASLVPLEGSNLIEASAGTGKTYSIAILALRLLIEKKILVNEILMVTFTKAAVAELEERLRLFIRTAYKASLGEAITDETIAKLVEAAIEKEGEIAIQKILRTAIIFLDETSVLTIHSFCQQTLTGFAFVSSVIASPRLALYAVRINRRNLSSNSATAALVNVTMSISLTGIFFSISSRNASMAIE